MNRGSLKNGIIVLIFCLFLAVPILTISWTGGDYSDIERRNLAAAPDLFQGGTINPEGVKAIKPWLEDHIGQRGKLLGLYANIKMHIFHQPPTERLHIGKSGWYYYTPDNNLEIASGEYPLTEELLEAILQHELAVREKLAEKGIDYVLVLPPSKVSIYPEYVRYGSGEIRETPADIVADYLEEHSDLKVIRLKEVLLEAKEEEQVYHKTDTHWNHSGEYFAYQEMIRRLEEWGFCVPSSTEIYFEEAEYGPGDLRLYLLGGSMASEQAKRAVLLQQNAVKSEETERYAQLYQMICEEKVAVLSECYHYKNIAAEECSVLIFGDSFFGYPANDNIIPELLAESFSELTFIRDPNIRSRLVDFLEPDVVIYEITERLLSGLPQKSQDFIQP